MTRERAVEFLRSVFEKLKESQKCIKEFSHWRLVVTIEEDYHKGTVRHFRPVDGYIVQRFELPFKPSLVLVALDVAGSIPSLTMVELDTSLQEKIEVAQNEQDLSKILPSLNNTYPRLHIEYSTIQQLPILTGDFWKSEREKTLTIDGTGFFDEWIITSDLTRETSRIKAPRFLCVPKTGSKLTDKELKAVVELLDWKLSHMRASLFEARYDGVLDYWMAPR